MNIIKAVTGWFSKDKKQFEEAKEVTISNNLKEKEVDNQVSIALVVYSTVGYFAMLPSNFNLEEHLEKYPLHEHGFKSNLRFDTDKLIYILGLLHSIPAKNKDLIREDGYIPISTPHLRNHIKDYRPYMDYLINTGVLECDEIYHDGRAMRYRLTSLYKDAPLEERHMRRFDLNEVNPILERDENTLNDYSYLSYWYEQKKLNIDSVIAKKYVEEYRIKKKLGGKASWDISKNSNLIDPDNQYGRDKNNIVSLSIHDYKAQINPHVHRLYSTLTSISKAYRNFVSYDGKELVAIDLKNCQPYLSCLLFNPEFWAEDSTLYLNFNQLPPNIIESIKFIPPREKAIPILIELDRYLKSLNGNEFNEYRELVSSGLLYEKVISWVYNETDIEISREQSKTAIFTLIYSPNRFNREHPNYWLMKYYKKIFPAVTDVFSILKREYQGIEDEKQHARFACLLQAIESEIILHRCCKKIWEQADHKIPIFTVHDSIVTTVGNEAFAQEIMEDEIFKCIGMPPKLDLQPWNNKGENLDAEIMQKIMIALD